MPGWMQRSGRPEKVAWAARLDPLQQPAPLASRLVFGSPPGNDKIPTGGEEELSEKAASYVCGVSDAPLLGDTIGRSLDLAAQRWGDRDALVSPSHGVKWSWRELAERVGALSAGVFSL